MEPQNLVLDCCGGKKCPVATKNSDGSVTLRDTDDGRDETIVLQRAQVEQLARFLGWK